MKGKKTIAMLLCLASIMSVTACGGNGISLNYPDRGYATADKNSWEQIEEGADRRRRRRYNRTLVCS